MTPFGMMGFCTNKLEHQFGVSGVLLTWFRSYLSGRSQAVRIRNVVSLDKPLTCGVPQGSVLGPILFLVFINDLFSCVQSCLDVFADDSTLWRVIKHDRSVVDFSAGRWHGAQFFNDLQKIADWARTWLVEFNLDKTELLTVSRKKDVTGGLVREGRVKLLVFLILFCSSAEDN